MRARRFASGGVGLSPYTRALVGAMTTPPSTTVVGYLNTFMSSVSQILDKMDLAYFLASHDQQSRNLNIIDPGAFTLTEEGSPAFAAYTPFQADTSGTQYLRTHFTASTHATKQQLENAEMGIFILDNAFDPAISSPTECGGTYTYIKALETTLVSGAPTTTGARINRNATFRSTSGALTNAVGLTSTRRTSSLANGAQIWKNGAQVTSAGGAAITLDNVEWWIGKPNDGVGTVRSNRKLGFFYAGAALSSLAEHQALYNALLLYLTQIGVYDSSAATAPPHSGGPDPYAPDASYVWSEASAGTPLDLTGYSMVYEETFDDIGVIAESGIAATSEWYAPVRTWPQTEGTFAAIDDAWEPFKLDASEGNNLRMRMAHDGTKWRGVHMQTSESDGSGVSFTKGYFECRMKTPAGGAYGAWPAFWLYGTQVYTDPDETRPEIDIVELYPGVDVNGHHAAVHLRPGNPYVATRVSQHWVKGSYAGMPGVINDGGYHTYGGMIDDSFIRIYFDGAEVCRMPTHPDFIQPLHMLVSMQLLIGEIASMDTSTPVDMWVDYVRVYQVP